MSKSGQMAYTDHQELRYCRSIAPGHAVTTTALDGPDDWPFATRIGFFPADWDGALLIYGYRSPRHVPPATVLPPGQAPEPTMFEKAVFKLLLQRADARRERDFVLADRLRNHLAGMGVVVVDHPDGQSWRINAVVAGGNWFAERA